MDNLHIYRKKTQCLENSSFGLYQGKFMFTLTHVLSLQGCFYAAEAFHFANSLLKGKGRFVETLFLPQSAIFCIEDEWQNLMQTVSKSEVQGEVTLYYKLCHSPTQLGR